MTGGEMAYMALVLTGFFGFAIVLFVLSRGFRDTATDTTAQPAAARATELPRGGAKAAV